VERIWTNHFGISSKGLLVQEDIIFFIGQSKKQRQACSDSQCGFCGCVALSKLIFFETPVFHYDLFLKKLKSFFIAG